MAFRTRGLNSPQTRVVLDEDLARLRRRYFQAAFDWWKANGRWPTGQELSRSLVAELDGDEIWRGLNWPWIDRVGSDQEPIALLVPALKECRGAEPLLEAFLKVLRLAVKRYLTPNVQPHISLADVIREIGLTTSDATIALELFKQEHLWRGIQGSKPAEWVIEPSSDLRALRDVHSVDDYVRTRYRNRKAFLDLGAREVPIPPQEGVDADGRSSFVPNTAFIIMPIDSKNPELVAAHRAVKEVFAEFGIEAERADDVQHDGVITEMILKKIRDAEFLVADLTAERPSVYYEVGYAHALQRRVMMFRWKDTRIHFDLAVHNVRSYVNAEELKGLLRARLEDRLGTKPHVNPA